MKSKKEREMEKRVYLAYHGDGLADLALGVVVLLFGLGMRYDNMMMAPIFASLSYPCWMLAKKRITERRLGYVEFSERRKRREKRGMVSLMMMGIGVLLLSVTLYLVVAKGAGGEDLLRSQGYLVPGIIFVVLSSSIGLVLDVLRMHVYSLVILALVVLVHFLGWPEPHGIILPGIIILGSGIVLMSLFLRKYPLRDGEDGASEAEAEQ